MILRELLKEVEYTLVQGSEEIEITALCYDSRKVVPDSVYVCIPGTIVDGHDFIENAIQAGAGAIVISKDVTISSELTVIRVEDARLTLALMSAAFFDHPAKQLKVIGITGTKGKTTTVYMMKSILENAGYQVGLMGTIETIIGQEIIPAHNTTPESYVIQENFSKMVHAGCDICVMEVSSQGLMMKRTAGFEFEIGIFTNLEPDHISPTEHANFEDYAACKGLLFQQCKLGVVNCDDKNWQMVLKDHTCRMETYGLSDQADLYAYDINLVQKGGHLGVEYMLGGLLNEKIQLDLPGRFSIYNSLAAIAVCRHFQVQMDSMKSALKNAHVKGRIEMIKVSEEFSLMIDYAHNAMALESLLSTLKEYHPGRLVCVFGCGGNRDKQRRYEMGEVSGRLADFTIITSDNPRFEEPKAIMDDIVAGMSKTKGAFIQIADRKEAIRYAILNGKKDDVIVLAGKGHEDYQEIKGVHYPMDERVLIQEILKEEQLL